MKDIIKKEAKDLGIAGLSFTTITDYGYLKELIKFRKKNNYTCEFEEQNIEKRINTDSLMPGCKSIITAIFPYASGYRVSGCEGKGNISVSSYGTDYHRIVNNRLTELCTRLLKYKQFNCNVCVDTTPLIDKAICKNSGLGYIGKNSMLINGEYGSFVFLGYILTDLDLDENEQADGKKSCGGCRACISKCPNNAIKDDGIIDTKRCISYLTQTKAYIPIEYRRKMGTQIYGCDVCQISCPENYKILNKDSGIDYNELLVDLSEILTISNSEFKVRYGHMAGSWRGKNIWKRNAIIACANTGYKKLFNLIKDELNSRNEMLRIYSAWALTEIDRIKGKDLIYNQLKYENGSILNEYKILLEG